jgi:hypothetical protein
VVVMYQGGEILYNILVEIQSSNKLVFWGWDLHKSLSNGIVLV